MRSAQPWVAGKIAEDDRLPATFSPVGPYGLHIQRPSMRDFVVFCGAVDAGEEFGAAELEQAMDLLPEAEFVTAVPTSAIAHSAYALADEVSDVAFGGFGDLARAISRADDVTTYLDREASYDRRRILTHSAVSGMRRVGRTAWEIHRRRSLPPVTVVTSNPYEFTAEQMRALVWDYRNAGINLEAVVVTNPSCRGFSSASRAAAREAAVALVTIDDFMADLGRR